MNKIQKELKYKLDAWELHQENGEFTLIAHGVQQQRIENIDMEEFSTIIKLLTTAKEDAGDWT